MSINPSHDAEQRQPLLHQGTSYTQRSPQQQVHPLFTDAPAAYAPPSTHLFTTTATTVRQFIQDSTAAVRDALPSASPGQFAPPANMPDVPDLYATWHAQRSAVNALGVMSLITMLVRFVPGVLGLFSAAVYYADAWTASICRRAKVQGASGHIVGVLLQTHRPRIPTPSMAPRHPPPQAARGLAIGCAVVSALLVLLYSALLVLLAVSPTWEAAMDHEVMPSLLVAATLVVLHVSWFGALTWLAVRVVRGMGRVLAAGNPVSAGIVM